MLQPPDGSSGASSLQIHGLANRVASIEGALVGVFARLDAMELGDQNSGTNISNDNTTEPNSIQSSAESAIVRTSRAVNISQHNRADRCAKFGVCVLGPGFDHDWSLPDGRYLGAAKGVFRGKFDRKPIKWTQQLCTSQSANRAVEALPEWLIRAAEGSPQYIEIENRLQALDDCVEKKRKSGNINRQPCYRCHSVASTPRIVQIHSELVRRLERCQTICETGFNRGDSALILTTACGPSAAGTSFTLNSRWYTTPGRQCLAEGVLDKNRSVTYIEGLTSASIPDFTRRNVNVKCDVIHVDGSKSASVRMQDLYDLKAWSHSDTLWVSDDIHAFCDQGICRPAEHRRCLYQVFSAFMTTLGLEVKCAAAKVLDGKTDTPVQCYGNARWNMLLQQVA